MSAFFVTGTDTGVGKTTVSVALLAAARQAGLRAAGIKPAESGCEDGPDGRLALDARALAAAAGAPEACLYRLRDPVSPNIAARREGVAIDPDAIAALVEEHRGRDFVLVEGAGGLLVPLSDSVDMADLARRLELPLLIVARDALGTINHTLLTVEVARARSLGVAGVVLSATANLEAAAGQENARELRRILGPSAPLLGTLPYAPGATAAELGALAREHLDLDAIVPRGTAVAPG